jgi:hypothetical protein
VIDLKNRDVRAGCPPARTSVGRRRTSLGLRPARFQQDAEKVRQLDVSSGTGIKVSFSATCEESDCEDCVAVYEASEGNTI